MLYRITPTYQGKNTISMRVHMLDNKGQWDIVCAGHPDCIMAELPRKAWQNVVGTLFRQPKQWYFHDYR